MEFAAPAHFAAEVVQPLFVYHRGILNDYADSYRAQHSGSNMPEYLNTTMAMLTFVAPTTESGFLGSVATKLSVGVGPGYGVNTKTIKTAANRYGAATTTSGSTKKLKKKVDKITKTLNRNTGDGPPSPLKSCLLPTPPTPSPPPPVTPLAERIYVPPLVISQVRRAS